MQKKKIEQQLIVNPPKTPQQLQFESQWKATEAKAEEPKLQPQPTTSKAIAEPMEGRSLNPTSSQFVPKSSKPIVVPPPAVVVAEKFYDDSFEDAHIKSFEQIPGKSQNQFGEGSSQSVPRHSRQNTSQYPSSSNKSFDHALPQIEINPFKGFEGNPFVTHNAIPGLEYEEETPMDFYEVDDEDDDQDYLPEDDFYLSDPPPLPNFQHKDNQTIDICDVLDPPGRHKRPHR